MQDTQYLVGAPHHPAMHTPEENSHVVELDENRLRSGKDHDVLAAGFVRVFGE